MCAPLSHMDIDTNYNLTIEGKPEDVENLEPLIEDLITLIEAVESEGPATKAPIVDSCRSELLEVVQENSEERIMPPSEMLDLLATYNIIAKNGEKFEHQL